MGINGANISNNQWSKLTKIYVCGVPVICLLALTATNWPINCRVYSNLYSGIEKAVDQVMICRFPKWLKYKHIKNENTIFITIITNIY